MTEPDSRTTSRGTPHVGDSYRTGRSLGTGHGFLVAWSRARAQGRTLLSPMRVFCSQTEVLAPPGMRGPQTESGQRTPRVSAFAESIGPASDLLKPFPGAALARCERGRGQKGLRPQASVQHFRDVSAPCSGGTFWKQVAGAGALCVTVWMARITRLRG